MSERKSKKYLKGKSKSTSPPRFSRRCSDNSGRLELTRPEVNHRSRSRSFDRDTKRRHKSPLPSQYRAIVNRPISTSSRRDSDQRSMRFRSRSPSPGDSFRRYDAIPAKPSRVLGVFGLSLYTDERVLKEVFSQYGPVEGIQVILDHHSGISRGFGFIYMRHLDDAIRAKELVPGTEIDGRRIRVDYSVTDYSHGPSPNNIGRPTYGVPRSHNYRQSPPLLPSRGAFYRNVSHGHRARSHSHSPRRFY